MRRSTAMILLVAASFIIVLNAVHAVSRPITSTATGDDPDVGERFRIEPRLIDINRADTATFQLLPGLGPALAERIVRHRDTFGRFASVEDLASVKGIGPTTLARFRDHVIAP